MTPIMIADRSVVEENETLVDEILNIIRCPEALVTDISNLHDFTMSTEETNELKREIENYFGVQLQSTNFKDMVETIIGAKE